MNDGDATIGSPQHCSAAAGRTTRIVSGSTIEYRANCGTEMIAVWRPTRSRLSACSPRRTTPFQPSGASAEPSSGGTDSHARTSCSWSVTLRTTSSENSTPRSVTVRLETTGLCTVATLASLSRVPSSPADPPSARTMSA